MQPISMPAYILAGSMGADTVGPWINIERSHLVTFEAVWIGTPTGAWVVEVSNAGTKPADTFTAPGTIGTALTLSSAMTAANPAGAVGRFMFEFLDMGQRWIRFVYDRTSSTGTLNVGVQAK
jgi:hypothetical protein